MGTNMQGSAQGRSPRIEALLMQVGLGTAVEQLQAGTFNLDSTKQVTVIDSSPGITGRGGMHSAQRRTSIERPL